jgi:hypothetical protein
MDLAAGEGVECNPHTFAVYPTEKAFLTAVPISHR